MSVYTCLSIHVTSYTCLPSLSFIIMCINPSVHLSEFLFFSLSESQPLSDTENSGLKVHVFLLLLRQICDMVTIARYLNVTLIVPELDKALFWADRRYYFSFLSFYTDFQDIFNVDYFIASVCGWKFDFNWSDRIQSFATKQIKIASLDSFQPD
jgi:hypothetical protein